MSSLRRGHANLLCIVPILVCVLLCSTLGNVTNYIYHHAICSIGACGTPMNMINRTNYPMNIIIASVYTGNGTTTTCLLCVTCDVRDINCNLQLFSRKHSLLGSQEKCELKSVKMCELDKIRTQDGN